LLAQRGIEFSGCSTPGTVGLAKGIRTAVKMWTTSTRWRGLRDVAETHDPIALELFKNAVFSIADEMALTVFRTTYSGVLKDNMDYSTGFADADGKLAAQGISARFRPRWNRSCAISATTWRRATCSS
jgi:hypothetical protein